ncbi:MAG: hypothetical protein HY540_06070 [Deltaproteobacteria bacterium]|nr:hypothetical protein [Deltaproteobacteria bacterium]
MGDFFDTLGEIFLPKPVQNQMQEVSVEIPVGDLRVDGDFTSGQVDYGSLWYDPKILYHSARAEKIRGLYGPVLELPTMLFQKYLRQSDNPDYPLAYALTSIGFGLATFWLGGGLAVVQHEYGHLASALAGGASSARLEYYFGNHEKNQPTAATIISEADYKKMPDDYKLLTGGSGLAAHTQPFRRVIEDALMTGNRLSLADVSLMGIYYYGNIGGYKMDAVQNDLVLHPERTQGSPQFSVTLANLFRPYGAASMLGSFAAWAFGDAFVLPGIIPDWNADFGPLGAQYAFRTYFRLDENTVIKPEVRFTTERPSLTAGFAYFLTGEEGSVRMKLEGELWYQPHFDGLGMALGTTLIVPIVDGIEAKADLHYKTYGYEPDAATLGHNLSGFASVTVSDKLF